MTGLAKQSTPLLKSPVVQASGLVKSFGTLRAVDGIDFSITPGQCFGFLGPNGAGKSTLLKLIARQLHVD
ncbi:MAG: hypothetical protein B7Z82_07490, partial [Halothiobacillus sp. 20-54-6]